MARTRQADHQRAIAEPQQREFFAVESERRQYGRQRGYDSDTTETFNGPVRRFQILKSTPLGLVVPQNVHFSVVEVEESIAHTGHSFNPSAPGHEPVMVTSELKWWKQKYMLPPSFEIFPGDANTHDRRQDSARKSALEASEVTGLPSSAVDRVCTSSHPGANITRSKSSNSYALAEIRYKGWQGLTQTSISLTLYNITPAMHYENSYSNTLADGSPSVPDIRSRYTINREGWKREYVLLPGTYRWRSPTSSEKGKILCASAIDDTSSPAGHGNLILEDSESNIVAAYKQRRDYEVLGLLIISTERMNASRRNGTDQEEGRITTEAVIASCLAIVIYERVGWQNLMGK